MQQLSINDMLSNTEKERGLFLSSAIIKKEVTSKPRRSEKREKVLSIEILFLIKKLDMRLFPLVNDVCKQ
jgi:hypothetical protein